MPYNARYLFCSAVETEEFLIEINENQAAVVENFEAQR